MKGKFTLPYWLATLILLSVATARAQSPGGVPVKAWYRADAPSTLFSDAGTTNVADNGTVYQWNEFTGSGFNLVQATASYRPVFSNLTTLTNFNPTVTFDGSNDFLQYTAPTGVNIIDRATGSLYAAGFMTTQKRSGLFGFHASLDYPGLHFYSDFKFLLYTSGSATNATLSDKAVQARSSFFGGAVWENGLGSSPSYLESTVSLNGDRKLYTGNQLYNVNVNTAYRDLRVGSDNNWGAFAGQISELMVFEDRLTASEMDRVESYLAIKYGTTYAGGLSDYKNAAGSTVWDATANNGYHFNIAGIARDDQGALYQKQSWSTSSGTQVLIGVGGLANTNADNAGTLSDGQYLIWGDNGLGKAPTVVTSDFPGISHRFAAIWKVQNTGSVGTVRIAWPKIYANQTLIQSTDATIGAGDVATSMAANEIIINGVVYNYADVTLADGSYFTFGAKLSAPGGVTTGLLMWHRSDDGTATAGPKNVWRDLSGNDRDVTQNNNAAYRPTLITDATYSANSKKYDFNFNPFYYFDGTNDFFYRQDTYFPATNSPGSAYGVVHNSAATGYRTFYGWGDDDPNLDINGNNHQIWRDNGNVINQNTGASKMPVHIAGMAWKGTSGGVYLNVNGRIYSTTYSIGSLNSAGNFAIGSEGAYVTTTGSERFQGGISEVFAYSVDHQNSLGDEKQRINSYLALKYGITLSNDGGTGVPNYLSSNSVVVWDATANAGYNNNIAGIARDENSALNQKQSKSINAGQQVIIGTTGLAATNALNSVSLNDGQFLVWGDNGLGKVPSVTFSGISGVNYRFQAVWKVQNTGSVGTVRVLWPSALVNLHLIKGTDPSFATFDSYYDMSGNTISINGVGYNYADVSFDDGEYFTFAAKLNGPAGIGADLRIWLRSDAGFDPTRWTDFSGNNNDYVQVNLSRQPFEAAKYYNFNPVVDFGTTGSDARFMVHKTGPYTADNASSTLFAITATKSKSGWADIIGFGSGITDGSGLQAANSPALTKLDNAKQLYPATAASGLPVVEINRLYLDDASHTSGVAGVKYGQNGLTTSNTYNLSGTRYATGSVLGAQAEVTNGVIGEIIAFERDLSNTEKEQVRSYLAIKYGITLAHDYRASNSSLIFWNRTVNTGYNNNIAGIARDDNGSLIQKQSQSINPGQQVLISTTGLADNNASNSQLLNDQQFLVWGDNGLDKTFSVTVSDISGINRRMATIWKVQNTGSVGTVRVAWVAGYSNLSLIQSADETFDGSDIVTPMSGTQLVNGVEYAYADVTLSDGQFFTFGAFLQAPGGVTSGLLMWHKGDGVTTTAGQKDMWLDVSGNNRNVYQPNSGDHQPQLVTDSIFAPVSRSYFFNYNPFFYFDGSNDFFYNENVNYFPANNSPGSVYTVAQHEGAGSTTTFSWGNEDPSLRRSTNQYYMRFNAGNTALSSNHSLLTRPTHIGAIHWKGTSPGTYVSVDGKVDSLIVTTVNSIQDVKSFAIGSNGTSLDNNGALLFNGGIAEVFAYSQNHALSGGATNEIQRINSYLALKYGITLTAPNGTNSPDYLNSNSDVIYAAETVFNKNIAGIGHDLQSALHQKQSRSVNANTNGQVIIGIGDIAENNLMNANSLADGQFLVWGDNGQTKAMSNTVGDYVIFDYAGHNYSRRMTRVWKVQNTGVTDAVKIMFPISSVGTTTLDQADACADYVLVYANDENFTTNVGIVKLTAGEDFYEVMNTFPAGVSYFTFGKATPVTVGTAYLPTSTESTTQTIPNCGLSSGFTYFAKTGDATRKVFGAADVNVDQLTVTISTEGTEYDDGTTSTRVMPRITTINDASGATYTNGKVRIYYSADEMAATMLSGAVTNGWFKYDGDAEEVLSDVFADGKFTPSKAVALTPDATGVEDGVNYVEFHNITSFSSFVYLSSKLNVDDILPVRLTQFTGRLQGRTVVLEWSTASESNNLGFAIERSTNAISWDEIDFVSSKALNGNSSSVLQYSYIDKNPARGRSYYRLKQTDIDGNVNYSYVVPIEYKGENSVILMKNPVDDVILLKGVTSRTNIKLYDINGRLLKTGKTEKADWVELNVADLRPGVYIVHTQDADGNQQAFKVLKK